MIRARAPGSVIVPTPSAANVLRNGMSAANIREVIENFDHVFWAEQITLTGNQTVDLSAIRSKTIDSLVSGKPALITDASTALIVGGQTGSANGDFSSNTYAPQFFGDMFILQSGSITNGTRGVFVNAQTYRLHFDRLWVKGFGGGIQGTLGDIRTLTIERFAVWNAVAFLAEFYSRDPLKEIDSILISNELEGNAQDAASSAICFSFGPSVGSSGKIGAILSGGILYRQAYGAYHWAVRSLTAATWAADVLTLTTTHYHSVTAGMNVHTGGFDNQAWNNTAKPLTITNITQANPGVVTTSTAHGYLIGTNVPISGVVGMTQVNGLNFLITPVSTTSFSIGVNTSAYTAYSSGGTAGGAWVALSGTEGKTIRVSMVGDPGSYTTRGYFTYHHQITENAGYNDFERPRNITYRDVSLRGQLEGGFYTDSGDNIVYERCVIDDMGISLPALGYNCSGTWAAVVVTNITQANPGVVTTAAAHPYSTGATVPINSVVGMTQVNDLDFTVTKINDTSFSIGVNTTAYTAYSSGGTAGGTATWSTWEADGTTPLAHGLSAGGYFNTRICLPTGYQMSAQAAAVPTAFTVTAPLVDDPGTAATTRNGDFYKPVTNNAHGVYFGQRAGSYKVLGCKMNENYGAGIYDDRLTDERSEIIGNRIFNSRYGYPNAPNPDKMGDLWFRLGRANMTILDNKLGAGDTWRFAYKSFVFAGNPAANDYVFLRLSTAAAPTYFVFVASDPNNDSSQPQVLVGASMAATIKNLRDAIHARDDVNCNAVRATPTDTAGTPNETAPTRLLITRNAPGSMGKEYTMGETSSVITLSPAGASFAGATGAATINYNIMNLPETADGERGNFIARNQMDSHTDSASNIEEASAPVVIRPNLFDNGAFSLDQANEGAAATMTSITAGVRLVDRVYGYRSGTNITGQRVAGTRQTYALRLTGAAGNTACIVATRMEAARAVLQVGQIVTMSVAISSPTVTRCALRLSFCTAADNWTADTNISVNHYVIGTSLTTLSFTALIPAGGANGIEGSIRFTDGLGAAVTVNIEELKLEVSGVPTAFVPDSPDNNLFACQRYYRKSFLAGTAPAQNAGVTGAVVGVQAIAGAVAQQFKTVPFDPPMRATPTVVTFNPSAANAQIRNTTAGADWTLTATVPVATGMTINGTGPGGGAAGDASAVHYTADADLG